MARIRFGNIVDAMFWCAQGAGKVAGGLVKNMSEAEVNIRRRGFWFLERSHHRPRLRAAPRARRHTLPTMAASPDVLKWFWELSASKRGASPSSSKMLPVLQFSAALVCRDNIMYRRAKRSDAKAHTLSSPVQRSAKRQQQASSKRY